MLLDSPPPIAYCLFPTAHFQHGFSADGADYPAPQTRIQLTQSCCFSAGVCGTGFLSLVREK